MNTKEENGMAMRGNRVKEKLNRGETVFVVGGHSNTSDTIDFLGPSGFDGIWLEGEHGPINWNLLGDLSRACDLWGMTSIARLHQNDPGVITRVLDLGANGIVMPHVSTKAEAEQVVQSAFFAPIGGRGMFSGRRSYGGSQFFENANKEPLVIVLIEEMKAIENLSSILTVDNIDVFFVAPADLAQTMGMIGKHYDPIVEKVVEDALQQIVASGRTAGALTLNHGERMQRYFDLGVRFFLSFYDSWLQKTAQEYLSNAKLISNGKN